MIKVSFKFDPNSTKNEGRFRLVDPDVFNKSTYRRWGKWGKKKLPKGISIVVGHHKEKERMLPQTIRFNKGIWTEKKARGWWNETGKSLFGKYKSWTRKDWKKWEKGKKVASSLLKIAKLLKADFPGHPETKVVRKNEYYPNGLVEEDIWRWYDKNKKEILPYLQKAKEILLVIKTNDGTIVKRNDKEGKPITVNKLEDFEKLNNGRNIEFHYVIGKKSDIGWVDLDPGKNFDFEIAKKIAKGLKEKLKNLNFIQSVDIKYTGGRGFHLILNFTETRDVNKTREELKSFLEEYAERSSEKLVLKKPKPSEMRLDVSTFHDKGSIRAPYSLNVDTGLASLYVLEKEKAKIK